MIFKAEKKNEAGEWESANRESGIYFTDDNLATLLEHLGQATPPDDFRLRAVDAVEGKPYLMNLFVAGRWVKVSSFTVREALGN